MKSITQSIRVGTVLVVAAMVAACSSAGGSLSAPSVSSNVRTTATASPVQATGEKRRGRARITIRIPRKKKQHDRRMHPEYISASTQSMTVTISGVPKQIYNLTPTSAGCATSGGVVTCSEFAFFPAGQQTIAITLYDGTNGSGNQLSTASTSVTVAAGAVTNLSLTLNGVPVTAKVLMRRRAQVSDDHREEVKR